MAQAENERKKKLSFRSTPTRPGIGNSKTIAKKCKKLINIIMVSFHAKTGWDKQRVIQQKKLLFRFIETRPGIGISKKIAKIGKKLKIIIMGSFQAKTGRDSLRVTQKKKKRYRSDPFQPDPK